MSDLPDHSQELERAKRDLAYLESLKLQRSLRGKEIGSYADLRHQVDILEKREQRRQNIQRLRAQTPATPQSNEERRQKEVAYLEAIQQQRRLRGKEIPAYLDAKMRLYWNAERQDKKLAKRESQGVANPNWRISPNWHAPQTSTDQPIPKFYERFDERASLNPIDAAKKRLKDAEATLRQADPGSHAHRWALRAKEEAQQLLANPGQIAKITPALPRTRALSPAPSAMDFRATQQKLQQAQDDQERKAAEQRLHAYRFAAQVQAYQRLSTGAGELAAAEVGRYPEHAAAIKSGQLSLPHMLKIAALENKPGDLFAKNIQVQHILRTAQRPDNVPEGAVAPPVHLPPSVAQWKEANEKAESLRQQVIQKVAQGLLAHQWVASTQEATAIATSHYGHLTHEQLAAVASDSAQRFIHAGPGTGKTKTAAASLLYQIATGAIDPRTLIVASPTHSGKQALMNAIGEHGGLLPSAWTENPEKFQNLGRTVHSVAYRALHAQDENGETALSKLGYGGWKILGAGNRQIENARTVEEAVMMSGQDREAYLRQLLAGQKTKPESFSGASSYISKMKQDQGAKDLYQEALDKGEQDWKMGHASNQAMLYLYEHSLKSNQTFDLDDLIHIWSLAGQANGGKGFTPKIRAGVFGEVQSFSKDMIRGILSNATKGSRLIFEGDIGQQTTGGAEHVDELLGKGFKQTGSYSEFPLVANQRMPMRAAELAAAIYTDAAVRLHGASPVQIAVNGNEGSPETYALGSSFGETHNKAIDQLFGLMQLTPEQMQANVKGGFSPFRHAAIAARDMPVIFQIIHGAGNERTKFNRAIFNRFQQMWGRDFASRAMQLGVTQVTPGSEKSFEDQLHLLSVQQAQSQGFPHPFVSATRGGQWDDAGYWMNIGVGVSRATEQAHIFATSANFPNTPGFDNTFEPHPGYPDQLVPHGFGPLIERAAYYRHALHNDSLEGLPEGLRIFDLPLDQESPFLDQGQYEALQSFAHDWLGLMKAAPPVIRQVDLSEARGVLQAQPGDFVQYNDENGEETPDYTGFSMASGGTMAVANSEAKNLPDQNLFAYLEDYANRLLEDPSLEVPKNFAEYIKQAKAATGGIRWDQMAARGEELTPQELMTLGEQQSTGFEQDEPERPLDKLERNEYEKEHFSNPARESYLHESALVGGGWKSPLAQMITNPQILADYPGLIRSLSRHVDDQDAVLRLRPHADKTKILAEQPELAKIFDGTDENTFFQPTFEKILGNADEIKNLSEDQLLHISMVARSLAMHHPLSPHDRRGYTELAKHAEALSGHIPGKGEQVTLPMASFASTLLGPENPSMRGTANPKEALGVMRMMDSPDGSADLQFRPRYEATIENLRQRTLGDIAAINDPTRARLYGVGVGESMDSHFMANLLSLAQGQFLDPHDIVYNRAQGTGIFRGGQTHLSEYSRRLESLLERGGYDKGKIGYNDEASAKRAAEAGQIAHAQLYSDFQAARRMGNAFNNEETLARYGHYLGQIHQITTGQSPFANESKQKDLLTQAFQERSAGGGMTFDDLYELYDALESGSADVQKRGIMNRGNIDRVLQALGLDPQDPSYLGLQKLSQLGFDTADKELPLTNLAGGPNLLDLMAAPETQYKDKERQDRMRTRRAQLATVFTRLPALFGKKYTIRQNPYDAPLGDMQQRLGMRAGMTGTLQAWPSPNESEAFGGAATKGRYMAGEFEGQQFDKYRGGLRLFTRKGESDYTKKHYREDSPLPPVYALKAVDGRIYPVRQDQIDLARSQEGVQEVPPPEPYVAQGRTRVSKARAHENALKVIAQIKERAQDRMRRWSKIQPREINQELYQREQRRKAQPLTPLEELSPEVREQLAGSSWEQMQRGMERAANRGNEPQPAPVHPPRISQRVRNQLAYARKFLQRGGGTPPPPPDETIRQAHGMAASEHPAARRVTGPFFKRVAGPQAGIALPPTGFADLDQFLSSFDFVHTPNLEARVKVAEYLRGNKLSSAQMAERARAVEGIYNNQQLFPDKKSVEARGFARVFGVLQKSAQGKGANDIVVGQSIGNPAKILAKPASTPAIQAAPVRPGVKAAPAQPQKILARPVSGFLALDQNAPRPQKILARPVRESLTPGPEYGPPVPEGFVPPSEVKVSSMLLPDAPDENQEWGEHLADLRKQGREILRGLEFGPTSNEAVSSQEYVPPKEQLTPSEGKFRLPSTGNARLDAFLLGAMNNPGTMAASPRAMDEWAKQKQFPEEELRDMISSLGHLRQGIKKGDIETQGEEHKHAVSTALTGMSYSLFSHLPVDGSDSLEEYAQPTSAVRRAQVPDENDPLWQMEQAAIEESEAWDREQSEAQEETPYRVDRSLVDVAAGKKILAAYHQQAMQSHKEAEDFLQQLNRPGVQEKKAYRETQKWAASLPPDEVERRYHAVRNIAESFTDQKSREAHIAHGARSALEEHLVRANDAGDYITSPIYGPEEPRRPKPVQYWPEEMSGHPDLDPFLHSLSRIAKKEDVIPGFADKILQFNRNPINRSYAANTKEYLYGVYEALNKAGGKIFPYGPGGKDPHMGIEGSGWGTHMGMYNRIGDMQNLLMSAYPDLFPELDVPSIYMTDNKVGSSTIRVPKPYRDAVLARRKQEEEHYQALLRRKGAPAQAAAQPEEPEKQRGGVLRAVASVAKGVAMGGAAVVASPVIAGVAAVGAGKKVVAAIRNRQAAHEPAIAPEEITPRPAAMGGGGDFREDFQSDIAHAILHGDKSSLFPTPSPEQQAIYQHQGDRLRILGGAGTGKTDTLLNTMLYRTMSGRGEPNQMMLMSYTHSGVDELASRADKINERLKGMGDPNFQIPDPMTLYSFAHQVLTKGSQRQGHYPVMEDFERPWTGNIIQDLTPEELGKLSPGERAQYVSPENYLKQAILAKGFADPGTKALKKYLQYIKQAKSDRSDENLNNLYNRGIGQGAQDLSKGSLTQEAALELWESKMFSRGDLDFQDLPHFAGLALKEQGINAVPEDYRRTKLLGFDEAQDINPVGITMAHHLMNALGENNPQLFVSYAPEQGLMPQAGGAIDTDMLRQAYDQVAGPMDERSLSLNRRSRKGTTFWNNALLSILKGRGRQVPPYQQAATEDLGVYPGVHLDPHQPMQYAHMFSDLLNNAGVDLSHAKENYLKGLHPLVDNPEARTRLGNSALVFNQHRDANFAMGMFEHLLAQSEGPTLDEAQAKGMREQLLRTETKKHVGGPEDAETRALIGLPAAVRAHAYGYLGQDIAHVGGGASKDKVSDDWYRSLYIGGSREKGGVVNFYGTQRPFSEEDQAAYLADPASLQDNGGGAYSLNGKALPQDARNMTEWFAGREVPRGMKTVMSTVMDQALAAGVSPNEWFPKHQQQLAQNRADAFQVGAGGQINIQAQTGSQINFQSLASGTNQPMQPVDLANQIANGIGSAFTGSGGFSFVRGGGGGGVPGNAPPSVIVGNEGGRGYRSFGGGGGGGGGSNASPFNNDETYLGRTMARIGEELSFVGKDLQQNADDAITEGSAYRQATLSIPLAPGITTDPYGNSISSLENAKNAATQMTKGPWYTQVGQEATNFLQKFFTPQPVNKSAVSSDISKNGWNVFKDIGDWWDMMTSQKPPDVAGKTGRVGSNSSQSGPNLPQKAAGPTGTEGYFDFTDVNNPNTIGYLQQNVLPMYSDTQIAQAQRQYFGATNSYFSQGGVDATTRIMALAAMSGMDPSQLINQMSSITGYSAPGSGQNANQLAQYQANETQELTGIMLNMFHGNLSNQNVQPFMDMLSSTVGNLAGENPMWNSPLNQWNAAQQSVEQGFLGSKAPTTVPSMSPQDQASVIAQMALNAGYSSSDLSTTGDMINSLVSLGMGPDLRQQYGLSQIFGAQNMTASPQLVQFNQQQVGNQMQLAGLQLQQKMQIPQVQMQIATAQISLDQVSFEQAQFSLAQNTAQFNEQQYQNNQLYGPIGADVSREAYFNFQRSQLAAGYDPTSPNNAVNYQPSTPFGLKNEEFYAGIENQRSMLTLSRSPLLADAQYQQQMKYLNEQENFYVREIDLQNQQRAFDKEWGEKSLDMQAKALDAQAKMLPLQIQMEAYQQQQAAIQAQYLPQQVALQQQLIDNLTQWVKGEGPVGGKNPTPTEIIQGLITKYEGYQGTTDQKDQELQQLIQGMNLPADQQGQLYNIIVTAASKHESVAQILHQIQQNGGGNIIQALEQGVSQGEYGSQQQSAGNANANLQAGGTGQQWSDLIQSMNDDVKATNNLHDALAGTTGLTKKIGDLSSPLSAVAGGIALLNSILGALKGLAAGGAGGSGGGGRGGGGAMEAPPPAAPMPHLGQGGATPNPEGNQHSKGPAGDPRNAFAPFFIDIMEAISNQARKKNHDTSYPHFGIVTPNVNTEFHTPMWYGELHQGVDFAAAQGSQLSEFIGGQVKATGFFPWGGEIDVEIPGGLTERYLHLSQIGVSAGQKVKQGQHIGLTGGGTPASGLGYWSSGSHLHAQIDEGDINAGIDPWPVWAAFGDRDIIPYIGGVLAQANLNGLSNSNTVNSGLQRGKGSQHGDIGGAGGGFLAGMADGGIAMSPIITPLAEKEPETVIPLSKLGQVLAMFQQQNGAAGSVAVAQPATPTVSIQTLVGTMTLSVNMASTSLSDAEKDQLIADAVGVLDTAIQSVMHRI